MDRRLQTDGAHSVEHPADRGSPGADLCVSDSEHFFVLLLQV